MKKMFLGLKKNVFWLKKGFSTTNPYYIKLLGEFIEKTFG